MALDTETNTKSDVWNIAKGYVTLKILQILVENDKLIKMALYGCENIEESINIPNQIRTSYRIEALERLHTNLDNIWNNAKFTILSKDKNKFQQYRDTLNLCSEKLDGLTNQQKDERTGKITIHINDLHFNNILSKLKRITRDINTELNNANLIFPSSEEFDLESIKDEIVNGG